MSASRAGVEDGDDFIVECKVLCEIGFFILGQGEDSFHEPFHYLVGNVPISRSNEEKILYNTSLVERRMVLLCKYGSS